MTHKSQIEKYEIEKLDVLDDEWVDRINKLEDFRAGNIRTTDDPIWCLVCDLSDDLLDVLGGTKLQYASKEWEERCKRKTEELFTRAENELKTAKDRLLTEPELLEPENARR